MLKAQVSSGEMGRRTFKAEVSPGEVGSEAGPHRLSFLQVSQYTFAMCSYREKKAEPQELLQLDGYTVDYTDPQPGTSYLQALSSQSLPLSKSVLH